MSDRWIVESEGLLRRMKELSAKKERDRLEIVNSILLSLDILERSLHGWRSWVRNLSLMAQFSPEELSEMESRLEKQVRPFVEYDIEASKKWSAKFPQLQPTPERVREEEERRGMYV